MKVIGKIIKGLLVVAFLMIVCVSGIFIYKGYNMYKNAVEEMSIEDKVNEIRAKENYTKIEELPDIYLEAIISVEDHRFYEHWGVDVLATLRASYNDIRAMSFVEGGSTITQQLAKNLYFTQEKKVERKVAEVFMAVELEKEYSKKDILELYVNSIYFGNNYYCVKDASMGYFGKEPGKMTEYESTLLAGIPNAPSVYALTANPDLAAQRQRQVLEKMIKYKYLTSEEAEKILE